ncbi:MAG: hypothetical protein M3393_04450 [Actinomycetota bacterium]|nr:hypothetical protein [Actinomycetota bacterium]
MRWSQRSGKSRRSAWPGGALEVSVNWVLNGQQEPEEAMAKAQEEAQTALDEGVGQMGQVREWVTWPR